MQTNLQPEQISKLMINYKVDEIPIQELSWYTYEKFNFWTVRQMPDLEDLYRNNKENNKTGTNI